MTRPHLLVLFGFVLLMITASAVFITQHAPIQSFENDLGRLQSMFRDRFTLSTNVPQSIVALVSAGDLVAISADQMAFYGEGDSAVPIGALGIEWCIMPKAVAVESLRNNYQIVPCGRYGKWQNVLFTRTGRHYVGSLLVQSDGAMVMRVTDRTCNSQLKNCPRSGKFDITLKLLRR